MSKLALLCPKKHKTLNFITNEDTLKSIWVLSNNCKRILSNKILSAGFYDPSAHSFFFSFMACFKLEAFGVPPLYF